MAREALLTLVGRTGEFMFSIDTAAFDELSRRAEFRWAEHERLGTTIGYQPIGEGRDEIQLRGVVYPHWKGGLYQIETLRKMMKEGGEWLMVDGQGRVHGFWVIRSVEEIGSRLMANGAPLRQEFTSILAYAGSEARTGEVTR